MSRADGMSLKEGGANGQDDTWHSPATFSPRDETHENSSLQKYQRLVFTDPAAFRYLEEDPSTTVLARRRRLHGYEIYMVEQWACSRVHPTFLITTYTGLEQHSVLVDVLSVPTNEETWSPRLRVYFKAITQYHARKKQTPLGTMMVTNLSGFPSALTVIAVPDGNIRKHREDFIVNENLKRMGCSGRAGLNLSPPVGATQAKFSQLYRTSEKIPLYSAVIELVKLCQVSLLLYGKLAPEYVDGLLCDVTEKAINDWWTEFGTEFFNVDPSDGILGSTTVAALLGILLGARNRLHAYGAPVAKDVFDLVSTKRGISYFQKSQKLPRTRRLDQETLFKLHRATAKAASGETWTVPRAVKSTVAELSGKGEALASGMVGQRDKAGIAEIETLDIETFIQLLSGERSKWLWYGKPLKHPNSDVFKNLGGDDGMIFSNDEQGGFVWSSTKRDSVVDDHPRYGLSDHFYTQPLQGSQASMEPVEKDQALRRTVLKSVTGKMTDARSGLGKIRDAVGKSGLRGHHHRQSKDGNIASDGESFKDRFPRDSDEITRVPESAKSVSIPGSRRDSDFLEDPPNLKSIRSNTVYGSDPGEVFARSASSLESETLALQSQSESEDRYLPAVQPKGSNSNYLVSNERKYETNTTHLRPVPLPKPMQNNTKDSELKYALGHDRKDFKNIFEAQRPLQRTETLPVSSEQSTVDYFGYRFPRHLSFSAVVDVLPLGDDCELASVNAASTTDDPDVALKLEESLVFDAQIMKERLDMLNNHCASWVQNRVAEVEGLDRQGKRDREELDYMYHQKLEEYNGLREASDGLLAEERASLTETIKGVDVLGAKLEYELGALQSKVEDVEIAVVEFERQVMDIETRAEELDQESESSGWWSWVPKLDWFQSVAV